MEDNNIDLNQVNEHIDVDTSVTTRRMLDFDGNNISNENQEGHFQLEEGENLINARHMSIKGEKIPKICMEFESDKSAYHFYNDYARLTGFSVRKDVAHRDKNNIQSQRILDHIFCCSCEGGRGDDSSNASVKSHRAKTRTNCGAMMKISGRNRSNYFIQKFTAIHNGHGLVSPFKSYVLTSHRTMNIAQAVQENDIDNSGITPRVGFELMTRQMGGDENFGFIFEDYKNYLRSKRTVEMNRGDTGGVLEYLQEKQSEDPNFFYAIQVDEDDLIANIFWSDARMRADFSYFGDAVTFDTTYKKNKDGRPFALFVGVNHHKRTIVFGATLLYAENTETFMWLYDTFAKAMGGKKTQTILTDQDAAMAKALAQRWPDTYHRLCIWHIYQNTGKHLHQVFDNNQDFAKAFSACIYHHDEEQDFLDAWEKLLNDYHLHGNEWLQRFFEIREKWALVYGRHQFCGGMMTTQRSESMNSALKNM